MTAIQKTTPIRGSLRGLSDSCNDKANSVRGGHSQQKPTALHRHDSCATA
jgi:hypothetical protein